MIKKLAIFLSIILMIPSYANAQKDSDSLTITSTSAVLIEGSTGKILYEKDKDKELIPASITKIMTLNLIFEALEKKQIKWDDSVSISEYAASMGGSQVYLEPNETQTVRNLIKCISIASANDAAVAMAEKVAGSEQAFIKAMNLKAKNLKMKHTAFKNCTGLDDNIESGHFSSAYDVALMSRELIMNHPEIKKFSTVWMDQITHKTKKGESQFGLTNTNKLVRFYNGITGLKTGSTSKAKYCLSATATRDHLSLIAVIMAAPDHKTRFSEAASLLDYGFATCKRYTHKTSSISLPPLNVKGGSPRELIPKPEKDFEYIFTETYEPKNISHRIFYQSNQKAPLKKGAKVGKITYYYQNKPIGIVNLTTTEEIKKSSFSDSLYWLFRKLFKY